MYHCWPIFPLVFLLIFLGVMFSNRCIWRRRGWGNRGNRPDDRNQALSILAKRLASGEIDITEYNTLKDVLEGNK